MAGRRAERHRRSQRRQAADTRPHSRPHIASQQGGLRSHRARWARISQLRCDGTKVQLRRSEPEIRLWLIAGGGAPPYGGGGEVTQQLCGFLGSEAAFSPLLASLPPVLKLDLRATASGAWIESSFRFAVSEIAAGRIGSATVITKLSELLFVEAVSQFVASLPAERRGWLAGLRDPQIGRALALLHARATDEWTAETLALEVGMSRSVFAERFTSLVGHPPMHYLALWRMHLAAQQLREGHGSVAQIAFEVGYGSEAAFSRAFKRQFGTSPGIWRRQSG